MESRHGLTTQVAYTWSHNISVIQNDLGGLSNPFDARYDRGSDTGFDRRHILNVSYIYALPFFKNNTSNFAAREILGGWSISGITVAEKGVPLLVRYTGSDTLGLTAGTNRPNLVSKVTYPKTFNQWFSVASYADPVAPWNGGPNQGFGNAGKDSAVGPGIFNWNLSLFKTIALSPKEAGPRVELRFESYNTFNHVNPQGINLNNHDANFGHVTSDYGPRTLQLGGEFKF